MKKVFREPFITFLKLVFLTQLFALGLFFSQQSVQAANCGGAVACNCGDTVTSSYTLTSDMTCSGHGLRVGADGITIDGGGYTITGDGGSDDYGINNFGGKDNIIIKNLNITNFRYGIYFSGSTGSTIQNVTASSNSSHGIYLYLSSSNTLTNNTVNSSEYGIRLNSSDENTLTGNTVNSNNYGIYLWSSSSSKPISGNTISNNRYDLFDNGTNTYSTNQFLHNLTSTMLTFTEITRTKSVGNTVSFSASAFNLNGTDCNGCTTIATYPTEAVTIDSNIFNYIAGHFTVTRPGTYSLNFTVTDSSLNVTKRRMLFFVGSTGSQITTYYLRGVNPTHGQPQPTQMDTKSLLLAPPDDTEAWTCNWWVQNSPDEIPDYPLANLSSIDTYSWYMQSGEGESEAYIGVQRYVTYNATIDSSSSVAVATDYTWTELINFPNLNWGIDYPQSWYWLSLKLYGSSPYWTTFPAGYSAQPSYADFTYQYTTTPALKSISNTDINVLSATEPATDPDNATLVLDGTGSANIVLDNYSRPFQGYTTTINSDGIATLQATGLTGETTINSVKMDITPSSGTIDVSITQWNTGTETYSKQWTETGTGVSSAIHTISDLQANTYYTVKVDGNRFNTYKSDNSGQITFTYTGGYSTKTFEITTPAACDNYNDDDSDGFTDYPSDPGCSSLDDTDETNAMYGGGGRVRSQTLTPTAETTDIQSEITKLQALITELQSKAAYFLGQPATASMPMPRTIPTNFQFTTNLKFKDISNDVKYLQIILNAIPDTKLANSGPGSSGKETNYFGLLTKQSVIKFQEKYTQDILFHWGLKKGTGFVGTTTRAKLNALMGR